MPVRRLHIKFDEYLIDEGIVFEGDYNIVHDKLDRDFKLGAFHREVDSHHTIEEVREWLRKWIHLAYQDTLTDYLRVALGHLVLDYVWSNFVFDTDDELITSAYRSFAQLGFGECFFKEN